MYRRLLLLGLLHQESMHGYRLHEFIDKNLHVCSDLKKPTAYFILDKLAQEGYVAVASDRDGHYPERKVYSLTPAGEAYFVELLRENLGHFERAFYAGDVGLAFMHDLPADERVALLTQRLRQAARQLDEIKATRAHGGTVDLVLERNTALLEAEVAWLDRAIASAASFTSLHTADAKVEQR